MHIRIILCVMLHKTIQHLLRQLCRRRIIQIDHGKNLSISWTGGLATGGSMELSYQAMLTKGHPAEIHVASIIASQHAIDHIKSVFPEDKTTIWCAAIDPEINEHSYIVPGLGDAGDLAYGEKE